MSNILCERSPSTSSFSVMLVAIGSLPTFGFAPSPVTESMFSAEYILLCVHPNGEQAISRCPAQEVAEFLGILLNGITFGIDEHELGTTGKTYTTPKILTFPPGQLGSLTLLILDMEGYRIQKYCGGLQACTFNFLAISPSCSSVP